MPSKVAQEFVAVAGSRATLSTSAMETSKLNETIEESIGRGFFARTSSGVVEALVKNLGLGVYYYGCKTK